MKNKGTKIILAILLVVAIALIVYLTRKPLLSSSDEEQMWCYYFKIVLAGSSGSSDKLLPHHGGFLIGTKNEMREWLDEIYSKYSNEYRWPDYTVEYNYYPCDSWDLEEDGVSK